MANPYFIKIELPNDSDSNSAVAGTGAASTGVDNSSADKSLNRVIQASKKLVSFAAAASTADKLLSYQYIETVSLRTGATEYEQRLNTIHSIGKQIVGAGAALAGGFMAGGPAGFTVAAIGLVASGINTAINIAQKEQTLSMERSLESISIGMYNVRAGVGSRRSIDQ